MRRALLTIVATLALAAPADAAEIRVTTTVDSDVCDARQCALRGAINDANANSEPDTIILPAGTYALSRQFPELQIDREPVTIVGESARTTTIEGSGATRVLHLGGAGPHRIANVTIAGGRAGTGDGGNVLVEHGASLVLDHVRLTRGIAARGGGVAAGGGGTLTIDHSLIDHNEARTVDQQPGEGGGVLIRADLDQHLNVTDSTIAFNTAVRGGGLMARDNPGGETFLRRVTVADNAATGTLGGGVAIADEEFVAVEDSLFVRNTGIGRTGVVTSNCSGGFLPRTAGGNVESGTDCAFELQNTDAGLAAALADDGGQTPTLALPWDSVAHDFGGVCLGTDQRDVARPQGAGCDPGAYEATPPPPPEEPAPTATAIATTVPTPVPTITPTPVANQTIVVARAGGTVRVKLPGAARYANLDVTKGIPVGSTVDTRKGRVTLTSIPRPGAPPETAVFYAGIFRVTQARGITNLTLTEPLAACPKRGRASAAAKAKKRRLWGDGKGAFRTSGKYSAATVRGTKWLVEDSCAGTLTRVTEGSVSVRDNVRKRTVVVRAGKRYTARPRR